MLSPDQGTTIFLPLSDFGWRRGRGLPHQHDSTATVIAVVTLAPLLVTLTCVELMKPMLCVPPIESDPAEHPLR